DGDLRYVTTLEDRFLPNWQGEDLVNASYVTAPRVSRMTPDGSHLLFMSPPPAGGFPQFYLYDAETGATPTCVSCRPGGGPSTSRAAITHVVALQISGAYLSRAIANDGSRVFFDTADPLVAADSNGKRDVYKWEDGEVSLISSGQGDTDSYFSD